MRRPLTLAVSGAAVGALALTAGLVGAGLPAGAAPTTTVARASGFSDSTGSGSASDPFCTPATFSQAQQTVEQALSDRANQLTTLVSRVDGAKDLTSSDQATLLQRLTQTDQPGIAALQSEVPGDTTCAQVVRDAHAMVFDYRVFVVATPQTDLVITTDAISHIGHLLDGFEPRISRAIDTARAHGVDVSGAESAFSDYQAQLADAASVMAGQSVTLLAQNAAGAPGNAAVFTQAFGNCQNARNDLLTARNDLQTIVTDLTGSSTTTTTSGPGAS